MEESLDKIKAEKIALKKIEHLASAIDKVYPSLPQLLWRSFLQGIFVALGTTIGFTIFLAIITFTLQQLRVIPPFEYLIDKTHIENVLPKKSRNN